MIRGAMPAIHRYLPLTVNPDAREWLATGLPAGEMRSAAITLKGDLDDFPYGAPGAQGESSSRAVRRRDRDYAPAGAAQGLAHAREPVRQLPHRQGLTLDTAGGALMHPAPGQALSLARDQRRHS